MKEQIASFVKRIKEAGKIVGTPTLSDDLNAAFKALSDPKDITRLWLGILAPGAGPCPSEGAYTREAVREWYFANPDTKKIITDGTTAVAKSGIVTAAGFNWAKALGME